MSIILAVRDRAPASRAGSNGNPRGRKVHLHEPVVLTSYFKWKRVFDTMAAAILLVLALPIIGVLILLVRLTSRGPGLYRQSRVGQGGRRFRLYKIRTMRHDAEVKTGAVWSRPGDPRVTSVGMLLRRFHLDELPQLFNVLKGEMSLVGPRPERPEFVRGLSEAIPGYCNRLSVAPGITGIAQLNLPPDTDLCCVCQKVVLDMDYIESACLSLDVRLVLCTWARMFKLPNRMTLGLFRLRREVRIEGCRGAAGNGKPGTDVPTQSCPAMEQFAAIMETMPVDVPASSPIAPVSGPRPILATSSELPAGNGNGNGKADVILNAFTVDVEDYYMVSGFEQQIPRARWGEFESRVVQNTRRILSLLNGHGVRATFFVLGWVARHQPDLVREIQASGHEIASHGYWHHLVYRQSPDEFRQDLRASCEAIEDAIDQPVRIYRAPSFSITKQSSWALDILAEEGFRIDSSIFPIHHDRYGMPDAEPGIHQISTPSGPLWEFPPSVVSWKGINLPVGGGGYFRLYPLPLTLRWLRKINSDQRRPFVFYIHPWEVDPDQPRILNGSRLSRLRHYVNLSRTEERLETILDQFRFGPLGDFIPNEWDSDGKPMTDRGRTEGSNDPLPRSPGSAAQSMPARTSE